MKAIICRSYGAPDGDVLVQVHAASVNPADWHLVRGTPFIARLQFGLRKPKFRTPGSDVTDLIETGRLILAIDRTYPLHEVPDAIRHVEEGRTRGKVIVTVTAGRATQEPTLPASAADDATNRS
jgi:NADPH:quinone reductase-like Zn-dependent oxidoreductase